MQKNKKLTIIIAAIAVVALAVAVFLIASRLGSSKLSENLNLGNQYLTEQNYEEAVAAFLAAIDIDPKCAEAYIGAADAYIGLGDYDSALAILEQGYEVIPEEELITSKLAETINDYVDILMENESYDEIRTLADDYDDMGLDVDFDTILEEVEEAETVAAEPVRMGEDGMLYANYDWDFRTFNLCGATVMEDGTDTLAAQFGVTLDENGNGSKKLSDDGIELSITVSETNTTKWFDIERMDNSGSGAVAGYHNDSYETSIYCESVSAGYLVEWFADYLVEGLQWAGMTSDDVFEMFHINELAEYDPRAVDGLDFYAFIPGCSEAVNAYVVVDGDFCQLQFMGDLGEGLNAIGFEYIWDENGNVISASMYTMR